VIVTEERMLLQVVGDTVEAVKVVNVLFAEQSPFRQMLPVPM
jgi:hypothetical protein